MIAADRPGSIMLHKAVVNETVPFTVIQRKTVVCSYPQITGLVLMKGKYGIATDTGRIFGIIPVLGKIDAIKLIKAIIGGKPHIARPVFTYSRYSVRGKAVPTAEINEVKISWLSMDGVR
jgi:hypothetical protein